MKTGMEGMVDLILRQGHFMNEGLMEAEDHLIAYCDANFEREGAWKKGALYISERRIICLTGVKGQHIVIPYSNIKSVGAYARGLFQKGMEITYTHLETGETVTARFTMKDRDKWMNLVQEKARL